MSTYLESLSTLFCPSAHPELVTFDVLEGPDGSNVAAVLTNVDDYGRRHTVDVCFKAAGDPTPAWVDDIDGLRVWTRHEPGVELVVPMVTAALVAVAARSVAGPLALLDARVWDPANI